LARPRAKKRSLLRLSRPGRQFHPNPDYPILAGQTPWRSIYIELKDFNEGRRSEPADVPMGQPTSRATT